MPRKKVEVIEEKVTSVVETSEVPKKTGRTCKKAEEVKEAVVATEKKVRTSAKKTAAKVEETVKAAEKAIEEKKPARRAKKQPPVITIQSMMSGEISVDEILKRVEEKAAGKAVTAIYIKSEENKAFYVADGEDGSIDLWD